METQSNPNKTQLEVLQMFKADLSEDELIELKQIFTRFLAEKAEKLTNTIWDKKEQPQGSIQKNSLKSSTTNKLSLTIPQIQEIAQEIERGMVCYVKWFDFMRKKNEAHVIEQIESYAYGLEEE